MLAAVVTVPKAAVDKDTGAVFSQYQIRVTWQTWVIETVSETMRPEIVTDYYLRTCALGSNRGHITMYLLGGLAHSYLKRT